MDEWLAICDDEFSGNVKLKFSVLFSGVDGSESGNGHWTAVFKKSNVNVFCLKEKQLNMKRKYRYEKRTVLDDID